MDLELRGLTALVTGASSGIGRATAEVLAEEGVAVALCARREHALREVVEQLPPGSRATVLTADLGSPDGPARAVAQAVEDLGGLDIVVNCATDSKVGRFDSYTVEEIEEALRAKPLGYLRTCLAALPHVTERRGVIVNVAGTSARSSARWYAVNVIGTAGVAAFTKNLADEVGPSGVRVVAVSPGAVRTARLERHLKDFAAIEGRAVDGVDEEIRSRAPLGLPEPRHVAEVITFLASRRAQYITGSVVTVDGGMSRAVG